MKNQINSNTIELLRRELEFRNYSMSTVNTYCSLMSHMVKISQIPLETTSLSQFKDYLRKVVIEKGLSASTVNQYISAFKIVQTDVLGREWEGF